MSEYVISDLPPPQAFLIFLAQRAIGKLEGTKGRERELLASEEFENYYTFYFREGDWGRGRFPMVRARRECLNLTVEEKMTKARVRQMHILHACVFFLSNG